MRLEHLKRWRVAVSLTFFVLTSLIFLDFASLFPASWTNGVVYLQFVPSLVKFLGVAGIGAAGFAITLLLTAVFGRVYCSSICPLGTLQDVISLFAGKLKKKKYHRQAKAYNLLRYSILIATIAGALVGSLFLLNLLDPFSSFGRILGNLIKPIVLYANNSVAFIAQRLDIYSVYPVTIKNVDSTSIVISSIVLAVILWMAYRHGRLYCNTLCPVGALLGIMSKFSVYRISIDADTCIGCSSCERVCKAGCIDKKAKTIDFTRCVGCYNCFTVCPTEGIVFERSFANAALALDTAVTAPINTKTDYQRRNILVKSALFVVGGTQAAKKRIISTKESTVKTAPQFPVAPPGAVSLGHFSNRCTACHLCVSACPSQVISPSLFEYGLAGIMQPRMNYRTSFCNFECTACTEICPSGALLPMMKEDKKLSQLGAAKFVKDNCIVKTEETECGACSEHCPTKAVNMVPYKNNLVIPEVKEEYCIGCGACEYACPTKPYKAIYIDGKAVHGTAKKPEIKKLDKTVQEEFPF